MEHQINKFIEPDPAVMEKIPAQMLIYDGGKWLEISNQKTINKFGEITKNLQKDALDVRKYIDDVNLDFQKADNNIKQNIASELHRLDQGINDVNLNTDTLNKKIKKLDADSQGTLMTIKDNLATLDQKLATAEKEAGELKLNIVDQMKNKSVEIDEAKKQALANAEVALKRLETDVDEKFEKTADQINQMVSKTDHDILTKQVTANETRSLQNQYMIALKADKTVVDEANTKITDLSTLLEVTIDHIQARAKQVDVDKLIDRVNATEASLDVNSNQIQLKADASSVDQLNQQVDQIRKSMLTVESDQIKSLVSSVQSARNQISNLDTQTQQTANTLRTLATKNEINTLTNSIDQAKSEWSQSSDGIKASVSAVNSKLDNLSFGGRNLLKQSQLGANYSHNMWHEPFGGVTWNSDNVELNVGTKDCVQIEQRVYDIEPNTDYVFSFDLISNDLQHLDKQGFIFWEFKDNSYKQTTNVYRDNFTSMSKFSTTPGRVGKKIVIHTQPDTHAIFFMVRALKGAKQPFKISKVKFEKGNKPTDYTPAPEDLESKIDGIDTKYAALDVKVNNINTVVANKSDKSYVDQKANEISSVVSNKADVSYVDQKADQWQVALQNAQNGINDQLEKLSGKVTATSHDLSSLYSSETYQGMQKIVKNAAFLQNANGFTSQVQQLIGNQLKQANLVYNSEFVAGTDSAIDGWTTNFSLERGTNRYDNYNGSTTLRMNTTNNPDNKWANAWSQYIDVEPGETVSASVVVFYTSNEVQSGICGLELEFWASASDQYRKSNKITTINVSDAPWGNAKLLKLENITVPDRINQMRVSLVIRGKGNVMFAHPMFVKGASVGVYQASVVGQFSKLTQTIAGLKSEVHDRSNNSVIAQTARMIALQVSGDKNKVISQINASTEGVMINGKHVMINGNTRIQGTLMVNDVVMKSKNNAVKFSPDSLDMIGANSILKLQNDSIRLGSTSSDPRKQWDVELSDDGLEFSVPAKKMGATTNTPNDYNAEVQGYIKGGGWDYSKMDTTGNGASGIEIGLMTKQIWGASYGGDYVAIGQYVPSSNGGKTLQPAISYSETGFGWAPKDVHIYKPTYFGAEVHFGAGGAQNGMRTAWVSWSDWGSEKYPCIVNDGGNWGGIAFPKNGNVVLFNNAGFRFNMYEQVNNRVYNNYGGY